jgi:hypothetical protein
MPSLRRSRRFGGKFPCHALKLRYVPLSAVKSKGPAMQSTRESSLTQYYLKR